MDSEAVNTRLVRSDLDALDAFAATEEDKPSRPEAIRRILRDWLRQRGYLGE